MHAYETSSATAGQAPLTVERIEDAEGLAALRPEWQQLLQASAADCLFLTWEWLATWWKHLSQGRRLHVLAVRRGSDLVGIAPLALRPPQPGRLLPFRALEFMGMGDIGSDYLDVIARQDQEDAVVQAVADYLKSHGRVLDLRRVRSGSRRIAALRARLQAAGWQASREATEHCAYIALKGHDWKSYIATVSRAHRANVNRRIRRLTEVFGGYQFARARTEDERQEYFREFLRLHQLRWSGEEETTAITGPSVVAFHDEFSRLALERGWLRLYLLRIQGRAVASTYSFRYGDKFYYYQAGYDPELRDHSPGLATLGLTVQDAIADKVAEFDMLHGREGYKSLWTHTRHELERVHCYPPNAHGALYRSLLGLREGVKRLARRPGHAMEVKA